MSEFRISTRKSAILHKHAIIEKFIEPNIDLPSDIDLYKKNDK